MKQALKNIGNAAMFAVVLTGALYGTEHHRLQPGIWPQPATVRSGAVFAALLFAAALVVIIWARRIGSARAARTAALHASRQGRTVRSASADGYTTR